MTIKSRKRPKLYSFDLSEEEKMNLDSLDTAIDVFDRLFKKQQNKEQWTGHQMTNLLSGVHDDYITFERLRRDPKLILYYRDLLAYLIKTYGH